MSDRPPEDPPRTGEGGETQAAVERRLQELGVDLNDPALWRKPPPFDTVRALEAAPAPEEASPRWSLRWLALAAVLIAVVATAALVTRGGPDWTIDLGPTSDYPEARGTLQGWNEGAETRMVLNMEGVAAAPDGFFYEMWMSRGPIHISAGTFVTTNAVELRAGVSRRDYPRLWVTLEPIDEDESPTRVVVLDTG